MASTLSLALALNAATTTLDFTTSGGATGYGVPADGNDLGSADETPRQQEWLVNIKGSSKDNCLAKLNALERLLAEARKHRSLGLGRTCTLTYTPDGSSLATVFDVLGGQVVDAGSPTSFLFVNRNLLQVRLLLDVEPLARSAESTVFSTGTLRARHGLTHRYIHYSGASSFSDNMAAVVGASLWQRTKFTTSPATATPQNGDILYFGNTEAAFDRLIMGIRTARTGTLTAVWEYRSSAGGGSWVAFTPDSDSFNSDAAHGASTAWDTVNYLGQIVFPTLANFTTTAINSVTAYWVRWRITGFTSMPVQPVYCNSINTLVGLAAIGSTDVKGDVPAKALVHLTNPNASALAGVRAGIVGDVFGVGVPPPLVVSLAGADLAIASGDTTATVATDANAERGERVEIVPNATLSDRAQTLDGLTQNLNVSISSGDKIDALGDGSQDFFVECVFKLDTITSAPRALVSRWNTSNSVFWLGIDQGKLRGMVFNGAGSRKSVSGSTKVPTGEWCMATLEYLAADREINIYYNSVKEGSAGTSSGTVRNGVTTALRVGKSVGFNTSDSKSGSASEVALDGSIGHVLIVGQSCLDYMNAVYSHDEYSFPNGQNASSWEQARIDSAQTRGLWQMNDAAASTTIVDSAVTFAAAKNMARSAGNTNVNTVPGVLQGGVAAVPQQILGFQLPQAYGQQFAGTYHVYLTASLENSATLSSVEDVEFLLQYSIGDQNLGFTTVGRRFPDIVPTSGGYFLLDMGPVTLPPVGMSEGHRATISARQQLQCYLYLKHAITSSSKKIYVDCLYFIPVDTWWAEWHAWRETIQTAYQIAQNEGLAIDSRGPDLVVSPTTTNGYTEQDRDPYQLYRGGPPRVVPQRAGWLFAIPLRGVDSVVDYELRNVADTLTPRLAVQPQWRNLAAN